MRAEPLAQFPVDVVGNIGRIQANIDQHVASEVSIHGTVPSQRGMCLIRRIGSESRLAKSRTMNGGRSAIRDSIIARKPQSW